MIKSKIESKACLFRSKLDHASRRNQRFLNYKLIIKFLFSVKSPKLPEVARLASSACIPYYQQS